MRLNAFFDALYLLGALWSGSREAVVWPATFSAIPSWGVTDIGARDARQVRAASGVAFVDVNVIPMDTERILRDQTVVVQGGRIVALGPSGAVHVPKGAVWIDGRGKYLMPGLADMHVHLGQGRAQRRGGAPIDSVDAERLMFLYLAHGVTTVRNMDHGERNAFIHMSDAQILRLKTRAAAGELLSPRIYTSGAWWPESLRHWWSLPREQRIQPESVAVYLRAYKAAGFDHIKPYLEGGEVLDSVAAVSQRLDLPLEGHLTWDMTVEEALSRYRYHAIEHAMRYDDEVHPVLDTLRLRTLAEATAEAGVWVTPTLAVYFTGMDANPTMASARLEHFRERRRRVVKALHDAGVGLLLGTDTPVRGLAPGQAVQYELRLLVESGLTPYEALATGTRNVAAFYGVLDFAGTVTVGKRADLILLAGNPLQDVAHTARLAGVMVGGRWVAQEEIRGRLADKPAAVPPE